MTLLCPHCRKELPGNFHFCPQCGTALASEIDDSIKTDQEVAQRKTVKMQYEEHLRKKYFQLSFNIGFMIMSIFQSFVGLLLWGIFIDRAPGISKGAGVGALVGVAFWIAAIAAIRFFMGV